MYVSLTSVHRLIISPSISNPHGHTKAATMRPSRGNLGQALTPLIKRGIFFSVWRGLERGEETDSNNTTTTSASRCHGNAGLSWLVSTIGFRCSFLSRHACPLPGPVPAGKGCSCKSAGLGQGTRLDPGPRLLYPGSSALASGKAESLLIILNRRSS